MLTRGSQFIAIKTPDKRRPFLIIVCGLLLIMGPASAHSHDDHHEATQTIAAPSDTVSTAQITEAVRPSKAHAGMEMGSPGEEDTLTGTLLDTAADLHSALVHFPIAWVLLLVLFEAWFLMRGRPTPEIGLPLAVLAALSFVPTAVTGLLHASEMASAAPALQEVILFHRNLALAGGVLVWLAAGLRLLLRRRPSAGLRVAYWVVLVAVLALSLNAGHQGGIIAHSEM